MTKLYAIQEVCKLSAVSIRTLHYYDEIDLLKPSHRTKKGHRLYSEENILQLQQIVTLKYIGLSLLQIKKILAENAFDIIEALKIQAKTFAEEAIRIKKVSKLINYLLTQHTSTQTIDWQTMTTIIATLKLKENDCNIWYEKYLSHKDIVTFKKFSKKRTGQWRMLFEEVKRNLHVNPESKKAQSIIKKWIKLADHAYALYPELKNKLWEGYKAGIIPDFPYDEDVVAYLQRALKKL